MEVEKMKFKTVDQYIGSFPVDLQIVLEEIRETLRNAAPHAVEVISYSMPAIKANGVLVYYAAFKNHIGIYALPSGNEAFKEELSKYKTGKGSIQFPLSEPMPMELITKIVKFRVAEDEAKALAKKK